MTLCAEKIDKNYRRAARINNFSKLKDRRSTYKNCIVAMNIRN
jgi:hypothetical protein